MIRRSRLAALLLALAAFAAAPAAERAGTVETNGVRLAYREAGKGTPLVLVHGSLQDGRVWDEHLRPLAAHHRVIIYSRRYHPPGAPTPAPDASVATQADDLARLITALDAGPAHIVGQSFGGTVAVVLAKSRPDLVRSLTLIEPGLRDLDPDAAKGAAERRRTADRFDSAGPDAAARGYAERFVPGGFDQASPAVRAMLIDNLAAFRLDRDSTRPPIGCAELKVIRAPTLLIAGGRSPEAFQRTTREAARCLPDARFTAFPTATHWLSSDEPEAFRAAVLRFTAALDERLEPKP